MPLEITNARAKHLLHVIGEFDALGLDASAYVAELLVIMPDHPYANPEFECLSGIFKPAVDADGGCLCCGVYVAW